MVCVLGLDIGTTSTIGILIRLPNELLALAAKPVTLNSPQPGWAEEDPNQWWSNVCAITRELLSKSRIAADELKGIGVTGMLPAIIMLDEDGELLRPSIQQSDGRCGAEIAELRNEIREEEFLVRAGNGVQQQTIATKLRWIEKNEPDVFRRIATVFGSYDYINWRLTGERAVEQNWALEGGLIDLADHRIADDLVALAHIRRSAIPRKVASHEMLGRVTNLAAEQTGLPIGVPVIGGAADLIASALGAGIVHSGDVLLKFGGSVDVLVATDRIKPDRRMYLDYHLMPGLFVANGCMSTGGAGLNWFVSTFAGGERAVAEAAGLTLHQHLDRLAEYIPPGAAGVHILPYFLGEKTPIHDPAARGLFAGLSLNHTLGHLWRALLEAYGYAIRHHVEVLSEIGHRMDHYLISDGGSNSRIWMQIVADILQMPLHGLTGHPGSCLGAAWAAAVGTHLTADWSGVTQLVGTGERYDPNPAYAAIYSDGYQSYRDLYRRMTEPVSRR